MKILFYGDSITDAGRARDNLKGLYGLGCGYVRSLAEKLIGENPNQYEVINTGISGNRIVDLYSRIKVDCWNHEPDLISILIGVNDVWHELGGGRNGVEIERFENVYRMLIEDTKKRLPNVKMMLLEPFVLEGYATASHEEEPDRYQRFLEVYDYAKVVKKLAEEYGLVFVPLQEKFNEGAKVNGVEYYLWDGVHPWFGGAKLIADEWWNAFEQNVKK